MVLIVFKSILTMMTFMAMGFIFVKTKLADISHGKLLSSFLVYFATPGMLIASFQEMEYSRQSSVLLLKFFFISLLVQILMFLILWGMLRKKMDDHRYRILSIGSFVGNVSFFGQPLIISLFPGHPVAACYCMMFATSMNILIFTIGEYLISGDRKYISWKRVILNPTTLAALAAVPLYLLQIRLPSVLFNSALTLRAMAGPVCMMLLGMRLASMNARQVFADPFSYVVSALKMLVFPMLALLVSSLIPGLDSTFKLTLAILAGTPCATVLLALTELHNCDQHRAATSVLMSSVLCIATLPLVVFLLQAII